MVSDTNAEINTAAASVTPNSLNSLPINPSKNITGKKTTASVIEVDTTAKNISLLPSSAACFMGIPFSNLLKIFSVTTIPSSTTKPVASTIPNKVNIFTENPEIYMMKKVATNEIGISISGLIAISQSLKKKNITSTTKEKDIANVSSTSFIDFLMLTVLSSNTFISISCLLVFFMASSFLLKSSAIWILLAPGCGINTSPTAFTPLYF